MTQEQVELIAIKTGEHLVDKFSDVVTEKINTAIQLHEARNVRQLDEALDEHIKTCPVNQTIQLTTKKIVIGSILFVVLSGGSSALAKEVIELLAKLL